MAWTNEDERLLKELTERKQAEQNLWRGCVVRVVELMLRSTADAESTTSFMIAHAEQIRKVLEPFDPSVKGNVL